MATSADTQTISGFYEEARGYLAPLETCLAILRENPAQPEALNEIHRLIHLIRGASAVVGLPQLTTLSADLESYLDGLLSGILDWDDYTLETISEAAGLIHAQLGEPPTPASSVENEINQDLIEGFLIEAEEALESVSANLLELKKDPSNRTALLDLRRAIHTIKGAGGMVGLGTLSKVAHRMEDLLDAIANEELTFNPAIERVLHQTADLLTDLVAAGGSSPSIEAKIPALFDLYAPIVESRKSQPTPFMAQDQAVSFDSSSHVRVPLDRVDELVRLVTELFVHRFSFERSLSKFGHELGELSLSQRRFQQLGTAFEENNILVQSGAHHVDAAEFDPLEFDRYTRLYTHSRDLNEATADVGAAQSQLRLIAADFDSFLGREKRLTSQLQDRLLRFRMVPLSSVSARLHRTVRVAAGQSEKQAELTIEGASTELDKTMLEALSGPLEHLLRNALAHGIESPSTRQQNGKSPVGTITLSARHEGTQVVIRLTDDGAGIHFDQIKQRAILAGLISENDAMSEDDLSRLIFLPGFSTAAELSELAGRGLGLDVARNAVENLKGTLAVASTPGQGTTFTLRLPLTLAITKVLLVEVQGKPFAIPIASVREVARLEPARIDNNTAQLGNRSLPLHALATVLQLPANNTPAPTQLPIAVLTDGEADFALSVDRILEAREVVVKPFSELIGRAPHLIGATLLGDGSIVPILNPAGLLTLKARSTRALAPRKLKALEIMIVDDSLSVRRVIATLLDRQGWHTTQAKDGIEALELLRNSSKLPDLILMDVEMPRMDGFELTTSLRSQHAFNRIPIVMLTSRSGDKHRSKAFSCGVSDYLIKPYQDDHLLATIRTHVSRALPAS